MNRTILSALIIVLCLLQGREHAVAAESSRQHNLTVVRRTNEERIASFRDDPDVMVRPGLMADRKTGRVVVAAEGTGLGGGEIAEFFLIGEKSGHDYEALAIMFATPGDIHEALEFIGMTPGRGVDYEAFCFWPKGERVTVRCSGTDTNWTPRNIRMEAMVLDRRTDAPLPETGFVFIGSARIEMPDRPGTLWYAADVAEPHAIAASYNEPACVLDAPRQAPQGDVYGKLTVNPKYAIPEGALLEVSLEPERRDGTKRVMDLAARAVPGPDAALRICLGTNAAPMALEYALNELATIMKRGKDLFVTLEWADKLPIGAIARACSAFSELESDDGLRIEPPARGQLYYKAFLPREDFRDRTKRLAQPWELHLSGGEEDADRRLIRIEEVWKDNLPDPELREHVYSLREPAEIRAVLDEHGPGLPVILVFAHPTLLYERLMEFVGPALPTHRTVYIFTEP